MKKLILSLIVGILLISMVSALKWDNVKTYDAEKNEITFSNSFLRLYETDTIATAKLDTPQTYYVFAGGDKVKTRVAEISIDAVGDYKSALSNMELIDLKTGKTINRNIEYRYMEEYNIEVPVYEKVCVDGKDINETTRKLVQICEDKQTGTKTETRERWLPFNGDIPKGVIKVGIYTNVYNGDYVEWYPYMFGMKVTEWAKWTTVNSALNWTFDNTANFGEETGTMAGQFNWTAGAGGSGFTLGYNCTSVNCGNTTKPTNGATDLPTQSTGVFCYWVKSNDMTSNQQLSVSSAAGGHAISMGSGFGGANKFRIDGDDCSLTSSAITVGVWTHMCAKINTTGCTWFVNGLIDTKVDGVGNEFFSSSGAHSLFGTKGYNLTANTTFDEVKFFNVSLTDAQILNMYQTEVNQEIASGVTVSLIEPINFFNSTKSIHSFYSQVSLISAEITNSTIYVWNNATGAVHASSFNNTHGMINNSNVTFTNLTYGVYRWNVYYCANNVTSGTCGWASANHTLTISKPIFGLCNDTINQTVLNLTFKDEVTAGAINGTITASINWYDSNVSITNNQTYSYSTANSNNSFAFCISPAYIGIKAKPTVNYAMTGYPQRSWNANSYQDYTNNTYNKTLYLLNSSDGMYTTFQVINNADQVISGVNVTGTKDVGGVTTIVCNGLTDSAGTVTCWVNPDLSHIFTFDKNGYPDYSVSLTPTQTSYTVILGTSIATQITDYTYGIAARANPLVSKQLYNDTTYQFNLSISTSYWDLEAFGFTLRLKNNTILSHNSSSSSTGGFISNNFNMGNNKRIYMDYYWTINSTNTTRTTYWDIMNSSYSGWGIKTFFTDFNNYTESGIFGLDTFGKNVIVFLVLFITIGILSYKYGATNPLVISGIVFAIVYFFDITINLLPDVQGIPNVFTFLAGLILVISVIREILT